MRHLGVSAHVRAIARDAEGGYGHERTDAAREEERHPIHGTLDVRVDEERDDSGIDSAYEGRPSHGSRELRRVNVGSIRRRSRAVASEEARAVAAEQHNGDNRENTGDDAPHPDVLHDAPPFSRARPSTSPNL